MVATILVLLVSATVVAGVGFATRQYNKSMIQSESKMLCSSLANIIRVELSNTMTVTLGDNGEGGRNVEGFYSTTYASGIDVLPGFYSVTVTTNANGTRTYTDNGDSYGELFLGDKVGSAMKGNILLSSKAYTTYNIGAKVTCLTYDKDNKVFHVGLSVGKDNKEYASRNFDVVPLNEVNEWTP